MAIQKWPHFTLWSTCNSGIDAREKVVLLPRGFRHRVGPRQEAHVSRSSSKTSDGYVHSNIYITYLYAQILFRYHVISQDITPYRSNLYSNSWEKMGNTALDTPWFLFEYPCHLRLELTALPGGKPRARWAARDGLPIGYLSCCQRGQFVVGD